MKEQAILDWLTSARKKIEDHKNGVTEVKPEESQAAAADDDVDSYYGEEEGAEGQEDHSIPIEVMVKYVADMAKFEEFLQS